MPSNHPKRSEKPRYTKPWQTASRYLLLLLERHPNLLTHRLGDLFRIRLSTEVSRRDTPFTHAFHTSQQSLRGSFLSQPAEHICRGPECRYRVGDALPGTM